MNIRQEMTGYGGDRQGIVQKFEIWPYERRVYAQPRIRPGEWDAQNSLGFWDTNGSPNTDQTTRPSNNQQKKKTSQSLDFSVPADY